MKTYLSVIIPCYNEERNLKRGVLKEVEDYLKKQKYINEVIVSDDGSTDGSLKLIEKFVKYHPRFKLLRNEHGGKPFAVKSGLAKARGEIVLFTDMDQSTPIKEIAKILPWFEKEYDLVIGSRGSVRKEAPLIRKIMARVFLTFRRVLLLPEIVDTQCGFKAFRRQVVKKIFPRLAVFEESKEAKGWRVSAYDVELLFVAKKLGFRVKEVVVNWQDRDISVGKQRNFIKESKEMLLEILRVKLNDWRGAYDGKSKK